MATVPVHLRQAVAVYEGAGRPQDCFLLGCFYFIFSGQAAAQADFIRPAFVQAHPKGALRDQKVIIFSACEQGIDLIQTCMKIPPPGLEPGSLG